MPAVVNEIVQKDFEMEIQARIDAGRSRLRAEAGLVRMREFKKPVERTFTAAERDYGGATCVIRALLRFILEGFLVVVAAIFLVLLDRPCGVSSGRKAKRLAWTTPALRSPRHRYTRNAFSQDNLFTHCQAAPQVVNFWETGSIEFRIVEIWQLKCTGTISTTKMAERSSFNGRGQRYAGSK